jgi:hypothetical protein
MSYHLIAWMLLESSELVGDLLLLVCVIARHRSGSNVPCTSYQLPQCREGCFIGATMPEQRTFIDHMG